MMVEVRIASIDDAEEIIALIKQLAGSAGGTSSLYSDYAAQYISDPRCTILIAEQDNKVVGMLSFFIHPNLYHAGNSCFVDELVVAENWRGKGVGSTLMKALLHHAEKANCAEVGAGVMPDNFEAQRFYQNHGFIDKAILLERHYNKPKSAGSNEP